MDSDWLMGERGNQKGKVPITYLELLNWDPQTPTQPSVTACDLIFILFWRDRPHFFFYSVIDTQKSLTFSRLKLNWIWVKGKGNGAPDVFQCNRSTFFKTLLQCLCVWCHATYNMCQNISQTETLKKRVFVYNIYLRWWPKCFWCEGLFCFSSLLIQVFWSSDTVDPFLNGKNALQFEVETDADYF